MKMINRQLLAIMFFAVCASSNSQILGFYPKVDTLFTAGGCTPTQIITSYLNGIDNIDTLKIIPDWNTWFWSNNNISYDNAYFVIKDSLNQYESELWMNPVPDYEKPLSIPTDSVVWFGAYEYYFQLLLKKDENIIDSLSQFCKARIGIEVKNKKDQNLRKFQIANIPNPFNQETTIKYCISEQSNVQMVIYNIKGQLVDALVDAVHFPGEYSVKWQTDNIGSGQYFIVLKTDHSVESAKCLLIR